MTKEKLTDEQNRELTESFPGAVFNFSQMISDNVEEAVSGVKGENSVKVFGNDLETNEKVATAIVDVMGRVPGVKDLGHFPSMGRSQTSVSRPCATCARATVSTPATSTRSSRPRSEAQAITQVYEGEKHFDLTVRWRGRVSNESRWKPSARSPFSTPRRGGSCRLAELADIEIARGRSGYHLPRGKDGVRYLAREVRACVVAHLASTIAEAQNRIDETLPPCDKQGIGRDSALSPCYD